MGYTLTEYRTNVRVELSDATTFFSDGEIDRAVVKTEHLMARLIPKKNVVETTITIDVDDETLAISSSTGTTTYKPIKYDSEVLYNAAGTKMVRGTNYTINYMTGVITEIGALLPDAADYVISYDIDPMRLDISSLVINPVRITRVEYPVGDQPPTFMSSYDLVEGCLIFHGDNTLTDGKHLRIYYDSPWTAAAASTDGDYPDHMSDALIVGAAGQCLIFKAEKYVQQSITELGLVNASADSMATPLADINTALDKVATYVADADTALDSTIAYLSTNGTTDNAKDVLANITDDIANLRTAIETALDAAATYLTSVDTPPSAHDYLVDGGDYMNTLNTADRVAEKHLEYAQASMQLFQSLVQGAGTRLVNLRTYIEEAQGWVSIADSFTAEAAQRLAMSNTYVNEAIQRINEVSAWSIQADKYYQTSRQYLDIAGRYLASGQAKINEFYTLLGFKPELQHTFAATGQATRY